MNAGILPSNFCFGSIFAESPTLFCREHPTQIAEERSVIAFRIRVVRHRRMEVLRARDVYANPLLAFTFGPYPYGENDCLPIASSEGANLPRLHHRLFHFALLRFVRDRSSSACYTLGYHAKWVHELTLGFLFP